MESSDKQLPGMLNRLHGLDPFTPGFKQVNYGRTLVRKLLEAGGASPARILADARRAGDEFGFAWFNAEYSSCPVAIDCHKLSRPIDFQAVANDRFRSTEHFKVFEESRKSYSTADSFTLIFDYRGDGVPDLVLHDHPSLASRDSWVLTTWDGDKPYFVQSSKSFLTSLSNLWRPYA